MIKSGKSKKQILLHPYLLKECKGEGSFGKVYYSVDTKTGKARAVKVIPTQKIITEQ
jgi:serine/threonine protein kinase